MLIEKPGIHARGGGVGWVEILVGEVQWGFFSGFDYTAAYLLRLAVGIESGHRMQAVDCSIATVAAAEVVAAASRKQLAAGMN